MSVPALQSCCRKRLQPLVPFLGRCFSANLKSIGPEGPSYTILSRGGSRWLLNLFARPSRVERFRRIERLEIGGLVERLGDIVLALLTE